MATIVTRAGKGSALTFTEVDNNFTNLNADSTSNASAISNLQNDKLDKAGGTVTGPLTLNDNLISGGKVLGSSSNNSQSGSAVTLTPPSTEIIRLTNVLLTSISGITAGLSGQKLILINRTGTTVTIENESPSATATTDQIFTGSGAPLLLNDKASISLTYDLTTQRWNIVGGTGSGTGSAGINYISNPDASIGTTGYVAYNDGSAVPVDGTGGTPPAGLFVRSTTSPLRGSGDFNLVKTGSTSYLGSGVSYDFTIDRADLAKVLTVTFDYEVVSGTFASGDLAVYIIQDPSGTPTVIQPAGYIIQSATVGTSMKQIATFQTASNVTNYRLCIHIASASTSDYVIALDSISVGPQVVQYGAPVTDWQSYTPTFGGVTATSVDVKYRRVGDSIEVVGKFDTSAVAAATFTISLPSGLSIDTAKIPSDRTATLGFLVRAQSTVQTYPAVSFGPWAVTYSAAAGSNVVTAAQSIQDTGGFIYTPTNGSTLFSSGDPGTFEFRVPILGWSSTVQMSNDTDTRVVAARVFKTANQGPFSVETKLTGYTVDRDSHGMWDATNNRFNILVPGDYQLFIQTNGVPATTATQVPAYRINGGTSNYIGSDTANTGASRSSGSGVIPNLKAGDFVEIYHFTSANTTIQSGTASSYVSLVRISGPSAIAASETVAARYQVAAGVATSSTTPINFATRVFDTHGAVTTGAAWRFTAPVSGKFLVSTTGYLASGSANFDLYKNAVFNVSTQSVNSTPTTTSGSCVLELLAGDYIDVRGSSSVTTGSVGTSVYLCITRIGN